VDSDTTTNAKVSGFKDLAIWQRGVKLTEEIYRITSMFPPEEKFGLSSQLRRAAVSIPSNIAEGFTRAFASEYRQFLYVAIGSCAEVATQVTIAERLGYLKQENTDVLSDEVEQISKMIMGLIKKINQRLTSDA